MLFVCAFQGRPICPPANPITTTPFAILAYRETDRLKLNGFQLMPNHSKYKDWIKNVIEKMAILCNAKRTGCS